MNQSLKVTIVILCLVFVSNISFSITPPSDPVVEVDKLEIDFRMSNNQIEIKWNANFETMKLYDKYGNEQLIENVHGLNTLTLEELDFSDVLVLKFTDSNNEIYLRPIKNIYF